MNNLEEICKIYFCMYNKVKVYYGTFTVRLVQNYAIITLFGHFKNITILSLQNN